jgi:hypothetical protein
MSISENTTPRRIITLGESQSLECEKGFSPRPLSITFSISAATCLMGQNLIYISPNPAQLLKHFSSIYYFSNHFSNISLVITALGARQVNQYDGRCWAWRSRQIYREGLPSLQRICPAVLVWLLQTIKSSLRIRKAAYVMVVTDGYTLSACSWSPLIPVVSME